MFTLVAWCLAGTAALARTPADKPVEERTAGELLLYGWSRGIGASLLGQPYYGVSYRFEAAGWAISTGRKPLLSGVAFTLNRDFLVNVITAVLIESAEAGGQVTDSMGYARVGPSSNAGAMTSRMQPFSLDVSIFDQALGSQLNGAAADLYGTLVLWPERHGGATLSLGLNAAAFGAPRGSAAFAWVSWAGLMADFRLPLFSWWLAARVRAQFPVFWGRQGSLDAQPQGANLPEDRRYLARVDAMLEGYVTNLVVVGAGLTWGLAQLGEGLGFRADVGVRF